MAKFFVLCLSRSICSKSKRNNRTPLPRKEHLVINIEKRSPLCPIKSALYLYDLWPRLVGDDTEIEVGDLENSRT